MTSLLVRSDLRRRWRSWLALVVLIGLVGGFATAGIAGWSRTQTAMDRFLAYHHGFNGYAEGAFELDELEGIKGIDVVNGGDYFLLVAVDETGKAHPEQLGTVSPFSNASPENFRSVSKPIIVDGRIPDPDAADEVVVDEDMADLYDLEAGDHLAMRGYGQDQIDALFEGLGSLMPTGEIFDFTVTGIIREPQDVVPRLEVPEVVYLGTSEVFLGPAFDRAHRFKDVPSLGVLFGSLGPAGSASGDLRVDFTKTTRTEVVDAVHRLDPKAQVDFGSSDAEQARDEAERTIRMQAGLLLALAVLVAAGLVVILAQAMRRQLEIDRATHRSLAAIGASPRLAVGVALAKGGLVGLAGAIASVVVAIALSPIFPVGHARRAEIDRGVDVNVVVLAVAALAIGLFVVGYATISAWRGATVDPGRVRRAVAQRGGWSDRAAQAGFSPSIVSGVRAARLGVGRGTVVITVFMAAAGIVGALAFSGSEHKLATEPAMWGWTVDASVGDGNDPTVGARAEAELPKNEFVKSFAHRYEIESLTVRKGAASFDIGISAIENVQGTIQPRMLRGTAPAGPDQIALGGATARRLGASVGDKVFVDGEDGSKTFTVSGLVVMTLGLGADRIGEGTLVAPQGIKRLGGDLESEFVLIDYVDGADPAAAYDSLHESWGNTVLRPVRSIDVEQLHAVRQLPVWFSGLLAIVAVATLTFVLVLTIHRRRHDLALLRTLGFERRQLRTTVVAQALTLVVPAALLGAVLGLAVGRVAWSLTARSLGAPEVQVLPVLALVGVVAGSMLVGWIVAAIPGRLAARVHPAQILRTE